MIKRQLPPTAALAKLRDLCARSEQCSHEVHAKLRGWGVPDAAAAKILLLLKRDRYVDDRRYAMAFARDKVVFNRWGRIKISLAMRQKHLPEELISEAMESIDPDEYRKALIDVLAAKARTLPETVSYEARCKLLRHAASRGFETGVIAQIIKQPSLWTS